MQRLSQVNVLVGVKTNEWAEIATRQADQIEQLEERVDSLSRQLARFEDLDQRLAMLEGRAVGADEAVVLAVSDR